MSEYPKIFFKQVCPKCGKDDVREGSGVVTDGDVAWQEVTCNCGARYIEVYRYEQTEVWNKSDLEWEKA